MANDTQEQQKASLAFTPSYKTEWQYPAADPTATIYLHGLLCLCFDSDSECTVGVNHTSPSHTPKLGVWQKPGCAPLYELSPQDSQKIEIKVIDSAGNPKSGVYVYAPELKSPPPPPPPDRYSFIQYGMDLESDKFHNAKLSKEPSVLGPTFSIKKGLFSAFQPTVSKFELRRQVGSTTEVRDLGSVAFAITADIFLNLHDAILITEGTTILKKLECLSGVQYDIAIANACTGSGCMFDPSSPLPEKRSDFSLHYKATKGVNPADQFGLFKKPGPSGGPINLGDCIFSQAGYYQPFSDPAPCAPIIFGQTNKLL